MRPFSRHRPPLVASVAAFALVTACSGTDVDSPGASDVEDSPITIETITADPQTTEPETEEPETTEPDTTGPTETEPDTTGPTETEPDTTQPEPESTEPDTTDSQAAEQDPATSILEPRVGTWVVGDAGEVDVDLTPDGLVLLDVRANADWEFTIDSEDPDEIEVDFEQGNIEWQIEIEYENGILEIEIDQDIEPAEPGVVQVGEAGEIEFTVVDGTLQLVGVSENPGWAFAVTEEVADEIEIEFVNGQAEYDVEIELDDGQIEIEVDFEVEGPFSI